VIRLRWPDDSIDPVAAVGLSHRRLVRLRQAGPWTFTAEGEVTVATMQIAGWQADGWHPWEPGTDGCEFALATNPPPIEATDPAEIHPDASPVLLACGESVWVLPARRAPRRLGFDGRDRGPATAYGVAAFALYDRMAARAHTSDEVMRVCLLALSSVNRRLIPEVAIGLGLISTADIQPLLEAAWRIPKAPGGGATSSSSPPASTPAATPP
jgi:hypothetical protein